MKHIIKNSEPPELIEYRKTPGVCFESMDSEVKRALKKSLIEEQGYLCCYCGKRIEITDNLKIEHILSQSKFAYAQLLYSNMILSCDGGETDRTSGNKKFPEHCDSKKKDVILALPPTNLCCENCFIYGEDGSIDALPGKNQGIEEVIQILGLDNPVLKNQRKAAIDAYKDYDYSPEEWKKEIDRLSVKNQDGKYLTFCKAVEYYIKNYKLSLD